MRIADSEERILPASSLTSLFPRSHDFQNIGRFIGGAVCLAGLPIAFSLATKSGIAKVSIKMIAYFGEQKANFSEFSYCGAPIYMRIRMRVRLNGDGGGRRTKAGIGNHGQHPGLTSTKNDRATGESRPTMTTEYLVGSAVQSDEWMLRSFQ